MCVCMYLDPLQQALSIVLKLYMLMYAHVHVHAAQWKTPLAWIESCLGSATEFASWGRQSLFRGLKMSVSIDLCRVSLAHTSE